MRVFNKSGTDSCELTEPALHGEGEADIYRIKNQTGVLAKVFKPQNLTPELESKLQYMIAHPPPGSVLKYLAWPQELFYWQNGSFAGFSMKEFEFGVDINELHPYPPQKYAALDLRYRLIICRNIATTLADLHASDYVIGDFNPNNIRVNTQTCEVAILDTNSFQFTDRATKLTYPCPVAYDGFVAPELLASVKGLEGGYSELFQKTGVSFTKETDTFALAEHIFLLTMNGTPPFNGLQVGKRLSSVVPGKANDSIERNEYCFRQGYEPLAARTPKLNEIHPGMARLFMLAFDSGYNNPSMRPSAREWQKVLRQYKDNCLKKCSKDNKHYYYSGLSNCPHCAALERHKNRANSFVPKVPSSLLSPTAAPAPNAVAVAKTVPAKKTNISKSHTVSLNNRPFMWGIVLFVIYGVEWLLFALVNSAGIFGLLLILLVPISWLGLPLLIMTILERLSLKGIEAAGFGVLWIIFCIMTFFGPDMQGGFYFIGSWLLPLVCVILVVIGIFVAVVEAFR
jgi:DNA-binding helix-hairpin-helix protein with protein kinase domain